MLTGRIRPNETRVLDLPPMDLTDLIREVYAATPDGWDVKDVRTQTIFRVAPVKEIEGADLDDLRSKLPDGWMLLSVRSE